MGDYSHIRWLSQLTDEEVQEVLAEQSLLTRQETEDLIATEAAKPEPDVFALFETLCDRLNISPLEVLLTGMLPEAWLAGLLPHAWTTMANYTSTYAGTDEYVALFTEVGFVSDYPDLDYVRPVEPLTVYRGVPNAAAEGAYAIGWTTELERARWFAHRLDLLAFPPLDDQGIEPTVWRAEIDPDGVLGLFYRQNESEVLVNPSMLRNLELLERSEPVQKEDTSSIKGLWD